MTDTAVNDSKERIELVPLDERLAYLVLVRLAFAATMTVLGFFGADLIGPGRDHLMVVTGAYLLGTVGFEGLRRLRHGRGLVITSVMLLVDGIYLSWVTFATGGPTSPLRFLIYMHLISVTLLASHRTGLKVALWHSLLFFVAFYAQLAGLVEPLMKITGTPEQAAAEFNRASVLNVTAFWLVALGTAAFSALNERELRRGKSDLLALARMADELEDVNKPEEVAERLLQHVSKSFGFELGAVLAAPSGMPKVMASLGEVSVEMFQPHRDRVIAQAWRSHSAVAVKRLDAAKDVALTSLFRGARNVLVVPMFADSRPIGVLVLVKTEGLGVAYLEGRVISMLEQFASHGALALRSSWLVDEVWKMADTDALTGISNRRVFETTLQKEVMRAKRNGEQVGLVMLDLDNFKALNDAYGHPEGDEVLRRVGDVLASSARGFDTAARYGGEEFAVILPGANAEQAASVAERLRKKIHGIEAVTPVTASLGVASYPDQAPNATELLGAADEALYRSKEEGRDRVTQAPDPASEKAVVTELPVASAPKKLRKEA
jgi:two-component system cell cycle response regulator